jgi:serine/threonine protein kinase
LSAEDLKTFSSARGMTAKDEIDEQFRVLMDSYKNNRSQLNIIFDVLGTPSHHEMNFLDKRTADILRGLPAKPAKSLEKTYPHIGEHGLQLMLSMLRFNPADRITAEEALEHPYFEDIKRKGYINTYRTNNQHIFADNEHIASALKPIPLDANLEKIGESSEYLRQNVSCCDCC